MLIIRVLRNRNFILISAVILGLLIGNSVAQFTAPLVLPALGLVMTLSTTSITAKVALPFVVGVAIVHKNVSIANFLPENLNDSKALELAKKVKFNLNRSLGSYSSRVEIKTKGGKSYHAKVDILRGSIQNPLSTEELIAKFKDCAGYARKPLSASAVDRLIDRILNLEKVKNISEITNILS